MKFKQAELTFKHQLVWDPIQRAIVPFSPYPADGSLDAAALPFAGAMFAVDRILPHVRGDINPFSGALMEPVTSVPESMAHDQLITDLIAVPADALWASASLTPHVPPSSSAIFSRWGINRVDPNAPMPHQKNNLDGFVKVKKEVQPGMFIDVSKRASQNFILPAVSARTSHVGCANLLSGSRQSALTAAGNSFTSSSSNPFLEEGMLNRPHVVSKFFSTFTGNNSSSIHARTDLSVVQVLYFCIPLLLRRTMFSSSQPLRIHSVVINRGGLDHLPTD